MLVAFANDSDKVVVVAAGCSVGITNGALHANETEHWGDEVLLAITGPK